jgi:hypothetical protein
MVRVLDQYLPVKVADQTSGFIRVIIYLEDLGSEGS